MRLSAGEQLGPYQILAPIGAGGMGEVYRARDPRLGRDVAIKISKERFSDRFQREARAIAALNHPSICQIYDVGPNYLVMELIEGESLQGPMSIEKALDYAGQLVDALEAAHEKGIVHRDLKPANIKITPEGKVKVLDFGLAKTGSGDGQPYISEDSPTFTINATQTGMILGTASYMSPEQARGKFVDKRSDIWSFGVVIYEMVTGRQLFEGETITDILAAVVRQEPDLSRVPARFTTLLCHCLAKDPKHRLRDIGDARLLLQAPAPAPSATPHIWIWLSASLALAAAGLGISVFLRPAPSDEPYRLAINLPAGLHFDIDTNGSPISPDGRKVAFVAGGDLWIRSLDSEVAVKVPGTRAAYRPFWSPDQRSIGFFSGLKLFTVALSSGSRTEVASLDGQARGGSWSTDGTILFSVIVQGVFRVPSTGGKAAPVTKLDVSLRETAHYHPSFLPDGDHFLYMIRSRDLANSGVFVGSLKDPKLKRRVLADLSNIAFVPAARGYPGYLLFARQGALLAQRFDEGALRPMGEPEVLSASVGFWPNEQFTNFSASPTGTAVLGTAGEPRVQMTWLDRRGNATPVACAANSYSDSPRLSHDGSRVALYRYNGIGGFSLWLFDFKRGSLSRADEDGGYPAWSPDDRRILYYSYTQSALVRKDLDSAQPAEVVVKFDDEPAGSTAWSPDGQFAVTGKGQVFRIGSGDALPGKLPRSSEPRFSPDGKWLAYRSADGEIIAQEFPAARIRIQISNQGGTGPVWRRDMKELLYIRAPSIMAVDIRSTNSGLEFGIPHELFTSSILKDAKCDATPDGQRFLCLPPAPSNPLDDQLTVLINWRAGLRR